jgi:hypothetical protein
MQSLLAGLAVLIAALMLAQAFLKANPAVLARRMRVGSGALALTGALYFLVRGSAGVAIALGFLGTWLLGWQRMPQWRGWPGGGSRPTGQTSRAITDHLDVALDHETGAVTGRVLKGLFAGRLIEDLKPVELALLWQDCQFTDPKSAQILEAYLDQVHPTWREDMARGEKEIHAGPDGRMTAEEAYEILGLAPGASDDDIRRAHRELMLKLHPDRGGSTYLASKINEAKDVLLNG